MRAFSYEFGEDVHGIMNLMASVEAKKSYGGTSPENVSAAIAEAKKSLG